MAFCGDASPWSKVAFILLVAALGFHATGYGTNAWMAKVTVRETENFQVGLWKMTNCSGYYGAPCKQEDVPTSYQNTFVIVTQVFEGVVLFILFINVITCGFYVAAMRTRTQRVAIAIMLMNFIAATFALTGVIIWIAKLPSWHYPSWSLGLAVLALSLALLSGVLLIPDIRDYNYRDKLLIAPTAGPKLGPQPVLNTKFEEGYGESNGHVVPPFPPSMAAAPPIYDTYDPKERWNVY